MERHSSVSFDSIAEMILQQKKLMEALEAENRELRRQLADLRRGVGIAVVIEGKTIQLATGSVTTDPGLQALQTGSASATGLGTGPSTMVYPQPQRPTTQPAPSSALNGDRRESGTPRNPLADSFVL
jgi:hypothetical protein